MQPSLSRQHPRPLTEWLVDDLPNPEYGSPPADGTDLAFDGGFTNEIANRVRLGNRIQKFQRSASVSPLAEMIGVRRSSDQFACGIQGPRTDGSSHRHRSRNREQSRPCRWRLFYGRQASGHYGLEQSKRHLRCIRHSRQTELPFHWR